MEQIVETLASGVGNTVAWMAESGILFAIFAFVWVVFAAGLIWSQGSVDQAWQSIRDLPLNRYPDGQMRRLRADLAAASMHPVDGVWAANGSNEVLTELLQAYGGPGRRAAVFEPTYLLHSRLAHLTHTEVEPLALPDDFVLGEQTNTTSGNSRISALLDR